MPTGTVKWFNATEGYGFIAPEDASKDAFVHIWLSSAQGSARCMKGSGCTTSSGRDATGGSRQRSSRSPTELENATLEPNGEEGSHAVGSASSYGLEPFVRHAMNERTPSRWARAHTHVQKLHN